MRVESETEVNQIRSVVDIQRKQEQQELLDLRLEVQNLRTSKVKAEKPNLQFLFLAAFCKMMPKLGHTQQNKKIKICFPIQTNFLFCRIDDDLSLSYDSRQEPKLELMSSLQHYSKGKQHGQLFARLGHAKSSTFLFWNICFLYMCEKRYSEPVHPFFL